MGPSDILVNDVCQFCRNIPKLNSFRNRLTTRSSRIHEKCERDLHSIRNDCLTVSEMQRKPGSQQEKLDDQSSKLFLLTQENLRLKLKVRLLRDKLNEFAKRGSVDAICHQLKNAAAKGMLDDKVVLKDLLESTAQNFHVKSSNGK